jgi:hypothetical protein
MYVITGDKSYLATDYCPSRKYTLAKFTDGNGKQWWQLAYQWGWWTCYLNCLGFHDSGPASRSPMEFDTSEAARRHLEREREWLDRDERSRSISVEFENLTDNHT